MFLRNLIVALESTLTIIKMKKLSFPLIVALLLCIIFTLIGYDTLTTRKESQKYQEMKQNSSSETASTVSSNTPIIYCIGDSLTLGDKSASYPTALSSLTGFSVNKFGGAQDQSIDISIRMGKTKVYVNNITIPSETTPVNIQLLDKDKDKLDVLKGTGSNFTTVEIDGITGKLKYNNEKKTHTFTREQKGTEKKITKLTQVKADFPTFDSNSIAIIFTGSYDSSSENGVFKTITYQRSIISQLKTKKYIVVSLTSKRKFDIVDSMNTVLKEEHKDHFLDFRKYLLDKGLKDAHITASNQDKKDLQNKLIPSSLLKEDKLNGNSKFNQLLAEQIVQKMIDLKYITEKDIQS